MMLLCSVCSAVIAASCWVGSVSSTVIAVGIRGDDVADAVLVGEHVCARRAAAP